MLGNEKEIYRMLRMEKPTETVIDAGLKRFESEVAFLLRNFFFVYIGLISTIGDVRIALLGVILSLILLLVRFGAVRIATARCSELVEERPIMSVILTRGLAAAVLATLPLQFSNENPTSWSNLQFTTCTFMKSILTSWFWPSLQQPSSPQ